MKLTVNSVNFLFFYMPPQKRQRKIPKRFNPVPVSKKTRTRGPSKSGFKLDTPPSSIAAALASLPPIPEALSEEELRRRLEALKAPPGDVCSLDAKCKRCFEIVRVAKEQRKVSNQADRLWEKFKDML